MRICSRASNRVHQNQNPSLFVRANARAPSVLFILTHAHHNHFNGARALVRLCVFGAHILLCGRGGWMGIGTVGTGETQRRSCEGARFCTNNVRIISTYRLMCTDKTACASASPSAQLLLQQQQHQQRALCILCIATHTQRRASRISPAATKMHLNMYVVRIISAVETRTRFCARGDTQKRTDRRE